MMQTAEAYNYVFGAEHSKESFAKDMMARESNVILIDEFDKVNPSLYNAFYELFDEGHYVDTNYDVNLGQAIFPASITSEGFLQSPKSRTISSILIRGISCRLSKIWYKVDFPAPLTPAIKIYFGIKTASFQPQFSAFSATDNSPLSDKNFFGLLFRLPP